MRFSVQSLTNHFFYSQDTDVIFWEGDPSDPTRKPPEMYTLIENFCLGFRRLEIFGRPSSLRRGWITVMAPDQTGRLFASLDNLGSIHIEGDEGGTATKWVRETWEDGVKDRMIGGKTVVSMTPEIDALRPKSPFRPNQTFSGGAQPGVAPVGARFAGGNRTGLMGPQGQGHGQNQMLVQPMMGMGMNALGLGMAPGAGMMGEMMGPFNPMIAGMGGMNVPGMGNMAMANLNQMNPGGMGRMPMPMMGPMGMVGGFGGAGVLGGGMNGSNMVWGDQAPFGMENGWDADGMMNIGMGGMGPGMGLDVMNMGNGGMGMEQWGAGSGSF